MRKLSIGLLSICFAFCILKEPSLGKDQNDFHQKIATKTSQVICNPQQRVQRVCNIQACFTNWGLFGSQFRNRDLPEATGGCFMPDPDSPDQLCPSFEFPKNSNLEYLFHGSLWVGAIFPGEGKLDTLVSSGLDGWQWIAELWPDGPSPSGDVTEKSQKFGMPCFDLTARAKQEIVSEYSDTMTPAVCSPGYDDPWDNRHHKPLNIKVTQHTYSWEEPPYDNFIIVNLVIRNIGMNVITHAYLGIFMDTDIGNITSSDFVFEDDITGFLKAYGGKKVDIAWAADNDGDFSSGAPGYDIPTGVIGVKLLSCSNPSPEISYNWWTSDTDEDRDWGPWKQDNTIAWHNTYAYGRDAYNFPDSALGTPGGDLSKYFIMSNGETDFDQIYADVDQTVDGWLPPSAHGLQFACGMDTRFLFSFGPFKIYPHDSILAALAFLGGEGLHKDPNNCRDNLFRKYDPDAYYNNLDFSNLVAAGDSALSVYYWRVKGFSRGDANADEEVTISDVAYLINYIFRRGDPPIPMDSGDVNCDQKVNIVDVVYLVNYLVKEGPTPGDPDNNGIPDC